MKKLVRLTENDLHKIVKESVKRVLREAVEEEDESFYFLYSPEVGFIDGTECDSYEEVASLFNEHNDDYEDLTIMYAPDGDIFNADTLDDPY